MKPRIKIADPDVLHRWGRWWKCEGEHEGKQYVGWGCNPHSAYLAWLDDWNCPF